MKCGTLGLDSLAQGGADLWLRQGGVAEKKFDGHFGLWLAETTFHTQGRGKNREEFRLGQAGPPGPARQFLNILGLLADILGKSLAIITGTLEGGLVGLFPVGLAEGPTYQGLRFQRIRKFA